MSKREVRQEVERDLHEQQNVHRTIDLLHDMLNKVGLAAQLGRGVCCSGFGADIVV